MRSREEITQSEKEMTMFLKSLSLQEIKLRLRKTELSKKIYGENVVRSRIASYKSALINNEICRIKEIIKKSKHIFNRDPSLHYITQND
jgi:hypothetical protein